jgi:hypothetical protein
MKCQRLVEARREHGCCGRVKEIDNNEYGGKGRQLSSRLVLVDLRTCGLLTTDNDEADGWKEWFDQRTS